MPPAPELPSLTLPQMLRENARAMPDRLALRQKDLGIWQPITWGGYYSRAAHFGLGLRALGLGEGGHVGILSENRAEWVLAQLGAGLVGAVTIGVYPTSPANEVAYVLGHAGVEIVVCEDQEQTDKVLERLDELPQLRRIVVIEPKGLRHYPQDRITTFAELERLGAEQGRLEPGTIDACLARQQLGDTALIVYTSGSTGKPKGAMLSYRNMRAEAAGTIERLGLDVATTNLSYLPLCHVAEQMLSTMAPIYAGSCVSFGESIRTVQEDLREVAPSLFLGVPRIWEKLHSAIHIKLAEAGGWRKRLFEAGMRACEPFAEKPKGKRNWRERAVFALYYALIFRALQNFIGLREVKVALTGAAPIPQRIVRFFRTLGVPLVEVYGLTETSGMVTGQRLDHLVPGAVGEPVAGAEVRLGEAGELLVRGDLVFEGYYRNEEATRAVLRDGWLHTGDVAAFVDGQVRIVDRLKDIMITAGGKNLSPSEIENTVKTSAYIKECIVVADGRRYVTALIQIDGETVAQWAESQRIGFSNFRSLAEHPRVRELVTLEVERANAELAPVAQIKRFHLLTKELDHDDDEVTATMKVRRANIARKYAAEIEALYAPAARVA
ncbi:long-chain fatty acid--CoA ligase [Chelatococcus daeguensis]|uniref:AMP-dependent synthetase/ligase n=1 Tax=Chelatococcus daeguensis TaxID=444444 RepID=UPI0007AC21A7|nr:AMP-binding protein [Chelatococcus daeguensis]KZE27983.1 long-chain fatty acid--CoA ligase [Chelatococcus daeguensis]